MENFINGALSGCFGVLLSHPFDTIKTIVQTGKRKGGSLYRGVGPPLIGVGFEKAIVFGTYNSINSCINKKIGKYHATALSGAISGFTASLIVTPFEYMKIWIQNGNPIRSINVLNSYRGITATFSREIPGFSIYFTTFEYLKKDNQSKTMVFINGAISGAFSWVFIYPQDRIKTGIQSTNNTYLKTISNIYNEKGLMSFYKGFGFALMRGIPLHAGTFLMMDILSKNDFL